LISTVFIKDDLEADGARKIDLYKNETSDSAFSFDVLNFLVYIMILISVMFLEANAD
jgi:hypothetical protein